MLLDVWVFGQVRSLSLAVSLAYFGIRRTEMIHSTYVYLTSRVLCKIVHDVISHVLNGPIATQWNSTYRIYPQMVKQRHGDCMAYVFEYLLGERRAIGIGIYF